MGAHGDEIVFKFHRGERRFHRDRLFRKRLSQNLNYRVLVRDYQVWPQPTINRDLTEEDWAYRNALLRVHTSRFCSCWMCANGRKVRGERTLQEVRFIERFNDVE